MKGEDNKKSKHKFRAMTVSEWCNSKECENCEYDGGGILCDYFNINGVRKAEEGWKPYQTKDGKYILVEIKNDKF